MIILLILASIVCGKFLGKVNKVKTDYLNVFLFPHSHDDVGWVKTMMEYYQDSNGVQQIISSYMEQLMNDKTKYFSQVEIAFFSIWWNEQSDEMKEKVKELVRNGQLEFLSGGWCMNDEATSYYEDIIDQMTLGHKFLLQNFNYTPSIGWQVDPFGHSNTQALFSNMMGFNALFFGRIDQEDRTIREKNKELEFVIHPDSDSRHSILTHVNYYGYYSSPRGFDFDVTNPNRQEVTDSNLQAKTDELAAYFKQQQTVYRGNILAHTLGMDFQWSDAASYFSQMDRVMNQVNKNKEKYQMNIQYGTPKQYIQALNEQNITYPSQQEDFFPYADYPNQYWSGYFTSRSAFKGYVRRIGRYFQQVKLLYSLVKINNLCKSLCNERTLQDLAEALGTAQHHDAITGTARQYVNNDYVKMIKTAHLNMNKQVSTLLNSLSNTKSVNHVTCNFNGTNVCHSLFDPLIKNQTVILTIIDTKVNNDGIKEYLKISVPDNLYFKATDEQDNLLNGEILCVDGQCILYLQRIVDNSKLLHYCKLKTVATEDETNINKIEPETINVDADTQLFNKFKLNYNFYFSTSGAYVFKPFGESHPYGDYIKAYKFTGSIVKQIYIEKTAIKTWITNFDDENIFYVDTFVDSINLTDQKGQEVVIQILTDINNKQVFYTDSSGLAFQRRQVNHRDSWQMKVLEPVSGNYFPVNGAIMIKNTEEDQACAVINDRAQGGTSLSYGVIELMLQRRLNNDDYKGVYERLDEQEDVDNKSVGMRQMMSHTIVFYNPKQNSNIVRRLQYEQDLKPLLYFSAQDEIEYKQLKNKFAKLVEKQADENLSKFYIEPWINENQYLVRVHNFREDGIQKLNFPAGIRFMQTTLTGNQELKNWQLNRFKWTDSYTQEQSQQNYNEDQVGPMKIKTWIVTI
ncbi:unnamed protein product (macronuclear) [Paramecium tetraurelia]|uniref:Glycoside hydrolase family 38 central domain-containing protein n=1 Tax=Paramecium tetraurelia TaxID=5888 RepID=A0EAB1_PARTE|nr:uncharacterized protein GSPATT00024960001 [Paramecium tetraurelia]CAK92228.1 unnamed protein product [Paramecium tetraurelia]|eukprot:XP_001459625.1 hypothetical protein (macronuclear) [Paramecium tetraurelia strain d4-2]